MNVWMIDSTNMVPYYNASLCRALQAGGSQVTMITAPFIYDSWPIYQGVNVEFKFSRFLQQKFTLKMARNAKIRQLLRAAEYPINLLSVFARLQKPKPILHFQWSAVPSLDVWVWQYLKRIGYPLIYTAHNIIPHSAQHPPAGLEKLYAIPDRIIVHTPELAQELRSHFPDTAPRIRIIPLGLHFEDVPEISSIDARNTLKIAPETPIALFSGLIEPYKGVEYLIRAFSQVRRKNKQAQLFIAGKPNISVKPYQALIKHLKLTEAIHTHFEFIPTAQISNYFCAADVVVLPYLEASQSAVLLTAYRFGKAVIVTDTGGLANTVEPGKNGLVVPPGDENALAEALITILSNSHTATKMGVASRELGLARYNWQDIAHQTIAVYREIL